MCIEWRVDFVMPRRTLLGESNAVTKRIVVAQRVPACFSHASEAKCLHDRVLNSHRASREFFVNNLLIDQLIHATNIQRWTFIHTIHQEIYSFEFIEIKV